MGQCAEVRQADVVPFCKEIMFHKLNNVSNVLLLLLYGVLLLLLLSRFSRVQLCETP